MNFGNDMVAGENVITKATIRTWSKEKSLNWRAYLWYISQYAEIIYYDENSVTVRIRSARDISSFYRNTANYCDEMWSHNYSVDIDNDGYKSHHRGYNRNQDIIERLVREGRKSMTE